MHEGKKKKDVKEVALFLDDKTESAVWEWALSSQLNGTQGGGARKRREVSS